MTSHQNSGYQDARGARQTLVYAVSSSATSPQSVCHKLIHKDKNNTHQDGFKVVLDKPRGLISQMSFLLKVRFGMLL